MGGGWFGERTREAAKEARPCAKATENPTTTCSGCAKALRRAEDDELPRPAIDLAVAPVAAVGEIVRLQELLTPGHVGSHRRRRGGGCGISGDVAPGDSGPGVPDRYTLWSSSAGFHPGRTSDCNLPSRTLDSPISSGCIRGSRGLVASRKHAPGVPGVLVSVEPM